MKKLKIVFGVLAMLLWFSAMGLIQNYDSHRPGYLLAESKNILAQNNHGLIVYITPAENILVKGLMISACICCVISGFAYYRTRNSK